ncbi:MAG: FAD-dependent oxidoreductase [Deltaproteobacteria bacterium]|nr:FAD-dependent oxidoreductase [Deltaproteobacteria bacterium]
MNSMKKDTPTGSVMVIGAGIAGIQASLDLADSGYLVHLVEKNSAIGGVMAQLDKTFPTNDCSMCIISPKLVECGRHLNIDLWTMTEVLEVSGEPGRFKVKLLERPRFVDIAKCTACDECAKACPIEVPNLFDEGLRTRKAAYKLYPQAMPSAYAIEKRGTAPCKATCPAHVSIQGYIALINQGKYREALELFKEDHPFPAICGRVCHHPCEGACTRNDVDEPVAIQYLHRFIADLDLSEETRYIPEAQEPREEKIAVIGAGPAGLTAAYSLARQGFSVTVFEKLPVAGGMMAVGIPEYRLPRDIIAAEIQVIESLGVEIKTGVCFGEDITLKTLKEDGFKAVFLATGLHLSRKLNVEGEDLPGILEGVEFLRETALKQEIQLNKKVIVIGGGNVAIDVALSAKRLGAEDITLVCLEKREEMPAWDYEIEEALEEGVKIVNSFGPKRFIEKDGRVAAVEFKRCTAVFDEKGAFNPRYDDSDLITLEAGTVITAIGQAPDLSFAEREGIRTTPRGGLDADPVTLQTPLEWVFAGGDALYGPKSVVEAVACGKEAAESIRRYLNGEDLSEGRTREWNYEKPDVEGEALSPRTPMRVRPVKDREGNFEEVALGFSEEEARNEALRCLKCGICSECYQCVSACLAGAVDHSMQPREHTVEVGAIVLAPGFKTFDPTQYETYNYATHPNVVTSLEFERILSASGPFEGHLVRPSDHKEPQKIAWLQCVGSRDINRCDHGYCSAVCCMYAIKEAVIAKEHSPGPLDTAIFYMDMRTYGKDFEKYYNRAEQESGVRFIRSRIHSITPVEDGNLKIQYATEDGEPQEEVFDMVVLSVGLSPLEEIGELAERLGITLNHHHYAETGSFTPVATSREGIYVCGVFQAPKDIPQSVMEASASAAAATQDLAEARGSLTRTKELPPELDVSGQEPRVGVFVCNCGINIGGIADVAAVREYAKTLPNVVHVEDNLFTCSQDTQDKMKEVIKEKGINRVVVASCSPRTHEPLFQETIRDAGLNKYLFEMANIRDQNTWVHMNEPEKATQKAKDLVRMAVAKATLIEPLQQVTLEVKPAALIVGGGVAGMEAALGVAEQGCQAYLVEKTGELGGVARRLRKTWRGEEVSKYLNDLIQKVEKHPRIRVFLETEVKESSGVIGNFTTTLISGNGSGSTTIIEHGSTILATGGKEYKPAEYLYGQHPNVLTHLDLDEAIMKGDGRISAAKTAVFIQCVGSRIPERPYCSKVCCTHSLESALELKKINPEMNVYILYRDLRSYGFREDLYRKARENGVLFIRYDLEALPEVTSDGKGALSLRVRDHVLGRPVSLSPDLLILASAILPNENKELFELFKVPINGEGFLIEAHMKLRPVDFASEGLFMAGLAHYPKPIDETITQAKAAVARTMTILSKEVILVGGVVATVNSDRCAACLTCVRTCPYGAPRIGEEGYAIIDPAECRGCGACVAECPGKAISLQHFTDEQIIAKTDALFQVAAD